MIKLGFDRKRDYFEEQIYPTMSCLYDKNTFLVVLLFASESAWSFLLLVRYGLILNSRNYYVQYKTHLFKRSHLNDY